MDAPQEDYTVLIASVGAAVVAILLALCILCHRKRRRRRRGLHRPLPPAVPVSSGTVAGSSRGPRPPQHVCDELGERFASVDSVWRTVGADPWPPPSVSQFVMVSAVRRLGTRRRRRSTHEWIAQHFLIKKKKSEGPSPKKFFLCMDTGKNFTDVWC